VNEATHETWLPVPEWEGLYEVSNLGRVRSLPRRGTHGRILRPGSDLAGCRRVVLSRRSSGQVNQKVALLVVLAFHCPKPFPKAVVRHLDGDNRNDTPGNLRWGTQSENMFDEVRHGTHANASKTCCPKCGGPYSVRDGKNGPRRYCPPCRSARTREASRRFYLRMKAARAA